MMTITRRVLLAGAAGSLLVSPTSAEDQHILPNPTYVEHGAAIWGADPVHYFKAGAAKSGKIELTHAYNSADWRFSNSANLRAFKADPGRYMPRFGGYCSFMMSKGKVAPTQPDAFVIHEGRLYLVFNKATVKRFKKNIEANIAKAEGHWDDIYARSFG